MTEVDHTDVGAYALGLLDEEDRRAFEQHLARCDSCAAEFAQLSGMRELLTGIDPDAISPSASDPVEPEPVVRLMRRRAVAERLRRRRTLFLNAAAAVVLVLAGMIGGILVSRDSGPNPDSIHSPANHLLLTGKRYSATDPATGVTGVIGLEKKGWGTHVALQLSQVRGPLHCTLVAVTRDGQRTVITNWRVPPPGYGVPGAPDPVVVHGGTWAAPSDIARFEVLTSDGRDILTVTV